MQSQAFVARDRPKVLKIEGDKLHLGLEMGAKLQTSMRKMGKRIWI